MILGYTLTTFPKSLIQTKKQQKEPPLNCKPYKQEGPCIIGGESPDNRFSTQQGNN